MADVRGSTPLGSTPQIPSDLRKRGRRGFAFPQGTYDPCAPINARYTAVDLGWDRQDHTPCGQ